MSISSQIFAQKSDSNVIYLIRHAEKADQTENPDLSIKGLERAEKWNSILENIDFDYIYSTNFKRTIQTITPIAKRSKKEPILYNLKDFDLNSFLKDKEGKKILIVGHSNSIPKLINKFLNETVYPNIDEDNFGNLYLIVSHKDIKATHQLLKL